MNPGKMRGNQPTDDARVIETCLGSCKVCTQRVDSLSLCMCFDAVSPPKAHCWQARNGRGALTATHSPVVTMAISRTNLVVARLRATPTVGGFTGGSTPHAPTTPAAPCRTVHGPFRWDKLRALLRAPLVSFKFTVQVELRQVAKTMARRLLSCRIALPTRSNLIAGLVAGIW